MAQWQGLLVRRVGVGGWGGGKVAGKEAQKERTADGTQTDVGRETEGLTVEE